MFSQSVGSLERLEQVGLARPFLIKKLFELRNEIEHNDASPPSIERARELVDATWYFLRTTDYACKLVPRGVMLRSAPEGASSIPELWLDITQIHQDFERASVVGWLSLDLLADTEKPGYLPIEITSIRRAPVEPPPLADFLEISGYHRNKLRADNERFIEANAELPKDVRKKLWRLAFEAL